MAMIYRILGDNRPRKMQLAVVRVEPLSLLPVVGYCCPLLQLVTRSCVADTRNASS